MQAELNPLLEFITATKNQGASDEFVVALLRQNGWSEKRIYQAFIAYYESRTEIKVPNGGGRIEAAKDAFFYLLAFITLGIWTVQLGSLFFTAIDRTFANAALDSTSSIWTTRSLANDLAAIIVAFPLFLLVTRWIVRAVDRQPERLESSVRKWLTYIALVITATCMIVDLVTFLAYLLRGDLNTRFVLKVLTMLIIAGGVFVYYLDSLHREKTSFVRNRAFVLAALAVVIFGIAVGFVQIGSPAEQRAGSQDTRRLFDLSSLAQGVHNSWLARGRTDFTIPAKLEDLQMLAPNASTLDPVSGKSYEYTPLQGSNYRLCGTFARPSAEATRWHHSAGRACFTIDAAVDVEWVQRGANL